MSSGFDTPLALEKPPSETRRGRRRNGGFFRCASPLYSSLVSLAISPLHGRSAHGGKGPMIIISASGMATAGRVVHHLEHRVRVADPRTTVLLVGFQTPGTRDRGLQDGADQLTIHGRRIPVWAQVAMLHGLSAHAGRPKSPANCDIFATRLAKRSSCMVNRWRHRCWPKRYGTNLGGRRSSPGTCKRLPCASSRRSHGKKQVATRTARHIR